jgi:hypothetical protein
VPKVVRRHKGGHGWSALVRIGRKLLSERVRERSEDLLPMRGQNKKGKSESRLSSREVTKSKRSREGLDSGRYVHRERKENRIEKERRRRFDSNLIIRDKNYADNRVIN